MTRTPCSDTKRGELKCLFKWFFFNKLSLIVENVLTKPSSSENQEQREGKDNDSELIEGEESRESLAGGKAEDRFFLDLGSLIRKPPNPPPVKSGQQNHELSMCSLLAGALHTPF